MGKLWYSKACQGLLSICSPPCPLNESLESTQLILAQWEFPAVPTCLLGRSQHLLSCLVPWSPTTHTDHAFARMYFQSPRYFSEPPQSPHSGRKQKPFWVIPQSLKPKQWFGSWGLTTDLPWHPFVLFQEPCGIILLLKPIASSFPGLSQSPTHISYTQRVFSNRRPQNRGVLKVHPGLYSSRMFQLSCFITSVKLVDSEVCGFWTLSLSSLFAACPAAYHLCDSGQVSRLPDSIFHKVVKIKLN